MGNRACFLQKDTTSLGWTAGKLLHNYLASQFQVVFVATAFHTWTAAVPFGLAMKESGHAVAPTKRYSSSTPVASSTDLVVVRSST